MPDYEATYEVPGGTVVNGKRVTSITVRVMYGEDEVWLAKQRKRFKKDPGRLVTKFIALLTTEVDGTEVDQKEATQFLQSVLWGDRMYLMLMARALTIGDDLEFKYKCPVCTQAVSETRLIGELPFNHFDEALTEDEIIERLTEGFDVDLYHGYKDEETDELITRARMRYATGADQEEYLALFKTGAAGALTRILLAVTTSVGGEEPTVELLNKLSRKDRGEMLDQALFNAPGAPILLKLDCSECDSEITVPLPFESFF